MWRTKKEVPLDVQKIMKGPQVTLNQTEILDTHHHAHLDQIKTAEDRGQGHGLDLEGPEPVHLTPGQRDLEGTEDPDLKGHTIMILIADHTGVLHVERGDVPDLALIELGIVQTLRTTTGRLGQGQVTQVDRPCMEAHIKSPNHHTTRNLKKSLNCQILLIPQSWIKKCYHQNLKELQVSDCQILTSAHQTRTPVTVNLAPITSQRPAVNPLLPVCTPTLKHTRNAKKAAQVTLRLIIKQNHRPLKKALAQRRNVQTTKREAVGRTQSR